MVASATVRVMSAEEIVARAAVETPYLHWPERTTCFAAREMRLRQLSHQHTMGDFLAFVADLAHAQQAQLGALGAVPVPDAAAIDLASQRGLPPLPAIDWPRDPVWHGVARSLALSVLPKAPQAARPALQRIGVADADFLERQADALLTGVMAGLDLACAPVIAAALQVYWTHMLLEVRRHHEGQGQPIGRLDDETVCPCCGSVPTASITRTAGESLGQRYLHCSLCGLQWHMVRIKCSHCLSTRSLAYQSLDSANADSGDDEDEAQSASARAALATVQAETCDDCGHYLKIVHTDRDAFVDPAADDLATLTLDLLLADGGKQRHGVNLMLLFGDPQAPPDPVPDSGGA
jgi:FdhE protein